MRLERYLTEATTGFSSWKKYFKDQEVKTTLNKDAIVYDNDGNKTDTIIPIGSTITVLDLPLQKIKNTLLSNVKFNTSIVKIPFNTISKPITKGATEKLRINATNMTRGAKTETVTLANKTFEAKIFTSVEELSSIINSSIGGNKLIPDNIKSILSKYLNQTSFKNIEWDGSITNDQINELGKYLGELIIGLLTLNGELVIPGALSSKDKVSFVVPDDPSFSGVDSMFIKKADGTVIAISSKFGIGAKASFFSNLLPVLIKNKQNVRSKILKQLIDITEKGSLNPNRQGKDILYKFGFDEILGLGKMNPMEVYVNIRKGNDTPEVKKVINMIMNGNWKIEGNLSRIKSMLPNSLTSFFSRRLSYMINTDRQAIDELLTVLGVKDFWQANLNIKDWQKGIVSFKISKSDSMSLTIIGSKASMNDITGSQGMVNYLLK